MKNIGSKEDLLRHFYADPQVAEVLKRSTNEVDKLRAMRTVEYFLGTMYDAVIPALAKMKEDPAAAAQISEALKTGEGIIKESDGSPIASGSKG